MSTQDVDIDALVRGRRGRQPWMILVLLIVVAAVAVLAWYFTRSEEEQAVFEPQRVTAISGQLTTTVELSGSAAAAQTASLSFAVGGEVDAVEVEVGDEVQTGDVLGRLQDEGARRSLETAEVQVQLALLRLEELLESPSAAQIAAAERALASAEAQVLNATLTLDQIHEPPDQSVIDAAEQSVANALTQVSNAEQALAELIADVSTGDLAQAQQQVANAAVQLSNAEQALTDLIEGPSDNQIASAEQAVANAAAQLSNAEQALTDLIEGPSDNQIASAEQAVANAAAQLSSAEQTLAALTEQPSVADLESARAAAIQARAPVSQAESALERAEGALEDAQERFCNDITVLPEICASSLPLSEADIETLRSKFENSGSTLERRSRDLVNAQEAWQEAVDSFDAAWASLLAAEARLSDLTDPDPERIEQATESATAARAAWRAAEAALADLLTPASDAGVYQAEQSVAAARAGLTAARAQLADLREPATETDIFQAEQSVAAARAGLTTAEERLRELLDGADPNDVYQAQQTLTAAREQRNAAEANLRELLEPPTEDDVYEAELALASAQSAWDEAQASYDDLILGASDTTIAQQEQNVRLAEITYEQALDAMDDLLITAAFDGTVEAVNIAAGERIGAGATAFVVSTRNEIVVDLTVTEAEIFDLQELQVGVASFDAIEGMQYPVRITTINRVPNVEQGVVTYAVEAIVLAPLAIQAVRDELEALGVTVPERQPAAQGGQGAGAQGAAGANPRVQQLGAILQSLDLPEGVSLLQVVQAIANDDPLPEGVELPEEFDITDEERAQLRTFLARFAGGGGGAASGTAAVSDDRQLPVGGMSATVTILTAVRDEAVLVSTSAVRQIDGAFYVAVPTEDDELEDESGIQPGWDRIEVQIGESDGTNVEILSGLEAGATVLVGADSEGIAYSATQLPGGGG